MALSPLATSQRWKARYDVFYKYASPTPHHAQKFENPPKFKKWCNINQIKLLDINFPLRFSYVNLKFRSKIPILWIFSLTAQNLASGFLNFRFTKDFQETNRVPESRDVTSPRPPPPKGKTTPSNTGSMTPNPDPAPHPTSC